jgi:Flp pilus assembly protein CpaB
VTIAVTPRDAQKVILAAQSMKLSLALAYNNDPESLLLPISRISLTEISS